MKFSQTIQEICRSANKPLTPQVIRDQIKAEYPEHYRTPSHLRNVEKGHYKDFDHALLAQIYIIIRSNKNLHCDTTQKPMLVSWVGDARAMVEKNVRQTPRSRPKRDYFDKVKAILENAENYHEVFYQAATFSGPSLYFHRRAIETCRSPNSLSHMEYVYATLSSWGMHRLGQKGSKMKEFDVFCQSIESLTSEIAEAQSYKINEMNEQKWEVLRKIFIGLEVMETSISLVGNSKVMHHILPNIIPPVDREYTLQYLRNNKSIVSDLENEWSLLREIIEKFFIPIVSEATYQQLANVWLKHQDQYSWDTSPMKIVDNLVIGAIKAR